MRELISGFLWLFWFTACLLRGTHLVVKLLLLLGGVLNGSFAYRLVYFVLVIAMPRQDAVKTNSDNIISWKYSGSSFSRLLSLVSWLLSSFNRIPYYTNVEPS